MNVYHHDYDTFMIVGKFNKNISNINCVLYRVFSDSILCTELNDREKKNIIFIFHDKYTWL